MNPEKQGLSDQAVSPSMIRSVFSELKANGYSDNQITALSLGLMRMVSDARQPGMEFHHMPVAENQTLLGLPEEFESVYLANLM
ncbi:MAG: hypothetical protein GYA21_20180 [Myxococcales bacterium]|nr:hypothetical protein [Myxococcales bacterium]